MGNTSALFFAGYLTIFVGPTNSISFRASNIRIGYEWGVQAAQEGCQAIPQLGAGWLSGAAKN